jgi:hypothetical protein
MSPPFSRFPGYDSKIFTYKTADAVELKLDVLFPLETINKSTPVLLHYHGGFLVRCCLSITHTMIASQRYVFKVTN